MSVWRCCVSRCTRLHACAVWIADWNPRLLVRSLLCSCREGIDKEGALKELEQLVYLQRRGDKGGKMDREIKAQLNYETQ